jgi:hypothetical protein
MEILHEVPWPYWVMAGIAVLLNIVTIKTAGKG